MTGTPLELPKLADTRSTQRLLNILYQLEESLANKAAMESQGSNVTTLAADSELARLRKENRALKQSLRMAMDRLDALAETLQVQDEASTQESMAA